MAQPAHPTSALVAQRLLRLSYVGFVSLGLPDTVLGAAWPAMRSELGLPLDAAGAALLVTTAGVVLSSSTSSWLRARWGTGSVLIGSTLLAATALLSTALAGQWVHVLTAAFLAGLGGGAIDASLNDHVARHFEARQLSWLHACWGVGAATAPLVVASVLASGTSWRYAYGALASAEVLLSLSFLRTAALWNDFSSLARGGAASFDAPAKPEHARHEHGPLRWPMVASVLMFFLYGGLEAGAGLWTSSLLIGTRSTSPAVAGAAVALFWAALTVGRIAIGVRADAFGPVRALRFATYSALLAASLLALPGTPLWFAALALTALGLALAPIYPLAMHDTSSRFGTVWGTRLVGYQVAGASVGVATLPWVFGALAEQLSLLVLPVLFGVLALALIGLQHARQTS